MLRPYSVDEDACQPIYKITLMCKKSIYAHQLMDVEGNVLRNEAGQVLNVYKHEFADYLKEGKVRFIHAVSPGFAYFITSRAQLNRFLYDRKYGGECMGVKYFIYADDDMAWIDTNTYTFQQETPLKAIGTPII